MKTLAPILIAALTVACSDGPAQTNPTTVVSKQACVYTLSPTSGTIAAGFGSGFFIVTPSSASSECDWQVNTTETWLSALKGTTNNVSYSALPNSTTPRTGIVTVSSPGGYATFAVTQRGATCPPDATYDAIPAAGSFLLVSMGECYFVAGPQPDVPWIHMAGTMAGGTLLEVSVESNPGPARTGHITFSGSGLVRKVTFNQLGN